MASLVYAFWSITNVASVHCFARPEISPCTCEPVYSHNYVELSCEKVDSFHQIVNALSNKFDTNVNISLKISHSQLEDLEMRSFTDMNMNLVKLRMQWNNLRSVPELPFRGLSNVEFLSVSDNELEEIPKHMLNHMPMIKTLDVGRCRIRSVLQDDFKGNQMVTNIFLPINNISRIDKGAFPPGLVILHLGRNQIESLNGTLRDLNKLESLFINMNMISTLDDELPESNRIKLIIARNNRLDHLPESMRYMTKLETLIVQDNRIRSLDGILKNAQKLEQFNACNNEIAYLAPDEFQSTDALTDLDLAVNKIISLNGSLIPLHRLRTANFSFNEIEEFAMNEIRGLKHLKHLDLSHNRIGKLIGRQKNTVDQDSCLIDFNLEHNQLKSLDGALMGLDSLRILSLSYNQIERILPEDFIGLLKLEILELSHNQLLTLKEMETTVLPSLRILKVAYNNLTKLEKDFHGLPVLCQANLTNNQISSISTELVSATRCKNHNVAGKLELHLDDNPIMCDERLNELCPIMLSQEARIRGRSPCFENDQEVCSALKMIYPLQENLTILIQQVSQQAIPAVIVQQPLLQPIIAQVGIKPLIIAAPVVALAPPTPATTTTTTTSTTTTTTTTTEIPTTTTTTTPTPMIPTTTAETAVATPTTTPSNQPPSGIEGLAIEKAPMPVNAEVVAPPEGDLTHDVTVTGTAADKAKNDGQDLGPPVFLPMAVDSKPSTTAAAGTMTIAPDLPIPEKETNISDMAALSPPSLSSLPPEAPPLVLDIVETPIHVPLSVPGLIQATAANAANDNRTGAAGAGTGAGAAAAVAGSFGSGLDNVTPAATGLSAPQPQTEYATVEYIPNLDEFVAGKQTQNTLDGNPKSDSMHEGFPSVVLADLDNAPQSLFISDDPPENP